MGRFAGSCAGIDGGSRKERTGNRARSFRSACSGASELVCKRGQHPAGKRSTWEHPHAGRRPPRCCGSCGGERAVATWRRRRRPGVARPSGGRPVAPSSTRWRLGQMPALAREMQDARPRPREPRALISSRAPRVPVASRAARCRVSRGYGLGDRAGARRRGLQPIQAPPARWPARGGRRQDDSHGSQWERGTPRIVRAVPSSLNGALRRAA